MMAVIKMSDEILNLLAVYFIHHNILIRYDIPFEIFVDRYQRGIIEI